MNSASKYRLSKSKIAAFEHCPRRLWLQIHRREASRFDAQTLARFQFGHDVGRQARLAVPGGIMVDAEPDIQAALDKTAELMKRGPIQPIFEATFQHEDVLVRVDILEPDQHGGWQAIEVKASTRVKAYQLADLATQIWVMQGCGVAVSQAIIRHLIGPTARNRSDMSSLRFQDANVTVPIRRHLLRRAATVLAARKAVRGVEIHRTIGIHCQRPFACEFEAHCTLAATLPLFATSQS